MSKWTPFKELTKADKIFWITNISISIIMSILCVVLSCYYGFVFNWNNRLGSAVGMAFASLIPIAFELIVRRRLPNTVFLAVNIYILFAGVIGSALNVYYLLPWYDVLIHCIMGYAIAILGLFFICRMGEHKKMKAITIALFCLFFSLGIELLWEIFERALDVFFGQTAQGIKVDGTNSPLVVDTIQDFICNLSGALLFFVHFVVDRYAKVNFGMKYVMSDFSGERRKSCIKIVEEKNGINAESILSEELKQETLNENKESEGKKNKSKKKNDS